ncbi:unnamed protein product, partial [Symbiodinium sp. CCMP2456]
GKKWVPFSVSVVSLGVELQLEDVWHGSITVANKPGRMDRIRQIMQPLAEGAVATMATVAMLHGLLNFAGGQVMGFELKPAARLLSKLLGGEAAQANKGVARACRLALDVMVMCRPRKCPAAMHPPVVIYTDGACEKDEGSWGAVVVDPLSGARWSLAGVIPVELREYWIRAAGEQIICQVEAYAVVTTLYALRGLAVGRGVIQSLQKATPLTFLREMTDKDDVALTREMLCFLKDDCYDTTRARAIASAVRWESDWLRGPFQ